MNVILWFILAIGTIILTILTKPPVSEVVEFSGEVDEKEVIEEVKNKKTFADIMNKNSLIMYLIGLAGLVNIIITIKEKGLLASLSLNFVIFIFLTLNFFLYASPEKFIKSYRNNLSLATDVMIQFPFYGGISGMMTNSGLGILLVGYFTKLATTATLPLWSYISASLLNLFIPSQGGQWIVQGSIIIDAALELGARIPDVVNAFVYGDEATNLLQPLYVIPALSVVGMKLKDVWGYMAFIWIFWFIVTSIGLISIPALL